MVQDSPIKTPQLLTAIMAFEGFFFTHKMGFDSLDKEKTVESSKEKISA